MLCAPFLGRVEAAERPVTFEATLVLASNDPASLDRRLEQISFQLRRIFNFDYFRFMADGSASAQLPSQFSISLGPDDELQIQAAPKGDRIRAEVNWLRGGRSVLNTTVVMKRGAHAILGGVPHENGKLIVTLLAK